MGARYDKKTRERAKLEKKALFFVEINRQYCEHLPDNERGYMSMYGPADDAKAAQVSRLLLRLSGVSEEAIDSAYPVAELRGMERGGEATYQFLAQGFLDAMNDIGRYGHEKYGEQSFQHRRLKGDTSRGEMERTQPHEIGRHACNHFGLYLDGDEHDHFGTLKHQLAAVAFNAMMEYYFAGLDVATLSVTEGVDEWIDCKQELPPMGKLVIVAAGRIVQNCMYSCNEIDQCWSPFDEDFDCAPLDEFTHWMPLPKPPQSGVDGREK